MILTYSPYNSLSEGTSPNLAYDELGLRYLPKGYARAVADVLGTRNSSGCWDYGGRKEQQSGVDLVNALAKQPWANGKVAMIGGSYDGTTANMVAARGADAPGLAAIVPELAISRWYGYAYSDGVRYLGNSEQPTRRGLRHAVRVRLRDRAHAADPAHAADARRDARPHQPVRQRRAHAEGLRHVARLRRLLARARLPQGRRELPRVHARRCTAGRTTTSGSPRASTSTRRCPCPPPRPRPPPSSASTSSRARHQSPSGRPHFDALLDEFFDTTLRGAAPGPELAAPVRTQGRTAAAPDAEFRAEQAWPPAGGATQRLALGRGLGGGTLGGAGGGPAASFTDLGTTTEETALRSPSSELTWLAYQSAPLAAGTRIAGTPRLELAVETDADHGHLTPVLADIAPDGTAKTITRGFLNLRYRDGLRDDAAVPPGVPVPATVTFSPQDHTVAKGHRIGLILAGSNTVWAVPDTPAGTTVTVRSGTLELPTGP